MKIKLTTCTTSCYNSPYLFLRSDGPGRRERPRAGRNNAKTYSKRSELYPRSSCFDAKNSIIVSRNNAARVARMHLDRSSPSSPTSPKIISNAASASYFTSRFDASSGSRVPLVGLSLPPLPISLSLSIHLTRNTLTFLSRLSARLQRFRNYHALRSCEQSARNSSLYERTRI